MTSTLFLQLVLTFCLLHREINAIGAKDLAVVILSQSNSHHLKLAEDLRADLHEQARISGQEQSVVHLSHKDFPHVGGWTILPLIPRLVNLHRDNCTWIVFVEDRTKIDLQILLQILSKYDANQPQWIGHALYDQEATIIHHFAFYEDPQHFKYPNLASGVAINMNLLKKLEKRLKSNPALSDFGIDSAHELSLFIWDKGGGYPLKDDPALCIRRQEGEKKCASFPQPFRECGEIVDTESIYFAVKTCDKFHKDRVRVVKRTWAPHVTRINFFSNLEDNSIPTISLGIPNTEQGHCGKTMAILKYVKEEILKDPKIQWIVLADDDTILGVSRLRKLLSCYDPSTPVALGERYGYNVHSPRGYNYITGGGGTVLSRVLVEQLTRVGACECPSNNTPDDMYLGLCMSGLGVDLTHSPLFHQARPADYSPGYLTTKDVVSFHKHWMIDPINVYNNWFAEDDFKFSDGFNKHIEL